MTLSDPEVRAVGTDRLCACWRGVNCDRRRRLADEELSPDGRWFRWARGLVRGLTPASRRRVFQLARLASAVGHGSRQEDSDASEALWHTILARDDGWSGANAVSWAERRFRATYTDEACEVLRRRVESEAEEARVAALADLRPGCYYVSVRRDGWPDDAGYLVAGPYPTHAQALRLVSAVSAHARRLDPRGDFLAWGTARTEDPREALLGPWEPPVLVAEAPAGPAKASRRPATKRVKEVRP